MRLFAMLVIVIIAIVLSGCSDNNIRLVQIGSENVRTTTTTTTASNNAETTEDADRTNGMGELVAVLVMGALFCSVLVFIGYSAAVAKVEHDLTGGM